MGWGMKAQSASLRVNSVTSRSLQISDRESRKSRRCWSSRGSDGSDACHQLGTTPEIRRPAVSAKYAPPKAASWRWCMGSREVSVVSIKEVLRLWLTGHGVRAIARVAQIDRKTVRRYVAAARAVGLSVTATPRWSPSCFASASTTNTRGPITPRPAARSSASTRPLRSSSASSRGPPRSQSSRPSRSLRRLLQRGEIAPGQGSQDAQERFRLTRQGPTDHARGHFHEGAARPTRCDRSPRCGHDPLQEQAPPHRDETSPQGNPDHPAGGRSPHIRDHHRRVILRDFELDPDRNYQPQSLG